MSQNHRIGWGIPLLLWGMAAIAFVPARSAEPGVPLNSGRDPGTQSEKEWADNRWQQSEVGNWLTSVVDLPGGKIAKGLSIKVGAERDASVAYDLSDVSLRAAWSGGFLHFDPARYGIIGTPKPDGKLLWNGSGDSSVSPKPVFHGWHRREMGGRAIPLLHYRIGTREMWETPDAVLAGTHRWFVRRIQVGPGDQPVEISLPLPKEATPGPEVGSGPSTSLDSLPMPAENATLRFVACGPGGRLPVQIKSRRLTWTLPPFGQSQRVDIWFSRATPTDSGNAGLPCEGADPSRPLLSSLPMVHQPAWPVLATRGERGLDTGPFAVDTITAPYNNPFRALLFFSGVDFTSDGTGYACTIHGDVWQIRGVDDSLQRLEWRRFATGLFQPLGLKVRDDEVFVLGRDRITRLKDVDGNGETDEYLSFFDGIQTSTGGHDYVTCLEKDKSGNFYYVDPAGLHRVARDGSRKETIATGWRNPNGMGVRPDGGVLTVAPQQGTWTPSSVLSEARPGGYYGYSGPKASPGRPLGYDAHLCWIPHRIDNSSGSQVWVPSGAWGPLGGQCLHLLWGRCGLMTVLRDEFPGGTQGAVFTLPVKFLSGPNRGVFHPGDGHLYVAGSTGWQTSAIKDGAVQRVRKTDKHWAAPISWKARKGYLEFTWTEELERSSVEDPGSHALHRWNYRYSSDYGSKDWSVKDPQKEGHDEVAIEKVELRPDNRTIRLHVATLLPVMQMEWKYNVSTRNGRPASGQLWCTINQLPE